MSLNYKISTITLNSKINCEFNLINIGKYLEIDNDIIGVKYSYGNVSFSKGIYVTSSYKKSKYKKSKINQVLFYNQISLVILNQNSKHVNVKLFQNGSFHITGCKSIDDGYYITRLIFNKLKNLTLKTQFIILTTNEHSITLDCNNFIYNDTNQIIGYYNNDTKIYTINNIEYIFSKKYKHFISKYEINKSKKICNYNGIIIGEITQPSKYTSNKNITYQNCIINSNESYRKINDVFYINYKCNPIQSNFNESINDITDNITDNITIDVNCINITFSFNEQINGNKLHSYLLDKQYLCSYNPETYSGVKFIFKYPFYYLKNESTKIDGICHCSSKCICSNITFLIFQTGNVIATGFKTIEEIDVILEQFKTIYKSFTV
jgi:TATA-box binding protein (TBP) (component of TFIID and TFIIIB)